MNSKALAKPGSKRAVSTPRGGQKAAAVLALLDDNTLSALAGKMSPKRRDKLMNEVANLRSVPVAEQQQIAIEFAKMFEDQKNAVRGSREIAEKVSGTLYNENDEAEAEPQAAELDEMLAEMNAEPLWERVAKLPMKKLSTFFEDKSATVLSIALRELPEDVSSELAGTLDGELAKKAILQIATAPDINPLALEAIEQMISNTLLAKKEGIAETDENPGIERIAAILNRLTSTRREMVLEAMQESLSADDQAEIAARVLSFEALEYRLPRNAIPVIFREVADKDIITALRHAQASETGVADYLLKNISQRLAATYRERMEEMPTVSDEEGEKAQSAVICKLLEIVKDGRVNLLDPEEAAPAENPTEE